MTNEQYEGLRDTIHNALEETIINIDENTKKEIQKYTNSLEKEILKQRQDNKTLEESVKELREAQNELKSTIKSEFSDLKDKAKAEWDRLIEILSKLL